MKLETQLINNNCFYYKIDIWGIDDVIYKTDKHKV